MAQPSVLSVALANLQKSHEFLLKILDVCGNLPGAPGTVSDREMMAAVAHLARMTEAIIQEGDHARLAGGDFLAARALSEPPSPPGTPPVDDKTRRLQVILQRCLHQSEMSWRRAKSLEAENSTLRRGLKQVEADVVAAKSALTSMPANSAKAPRGRRNG